MNDVSYDIVFIVLSAIKQQIILPMKWFASSKPRINVHTNISCYTLSALSIQKINRYLSYFINFHCLCMNDRFVWLFNTFLLLLF